MSQTFFTLVISFFITISTLAFIFSLLIYNEGERVWRTINRRLLSLDHAVRLIFQNLDNAFDHVGRANNDIGAAYSRPPPTHRY
jgi:predicted PurR-regulated permease PerM